MRDKQKEPKRPQKQKKYKKRENKNKKREGDNTPIPVEISTLVLHIVFVLHSDFHIILA